jgi:pyruvate dehydrogenase E2 component (dihydrolipoamide acetyltransferase)
MPALSPTMKEGNLVKWYKAKGDTVTSGDVLADIETDKAIMEVEAVDEGTLAAILIEAGAQNVAVNTPIAVLLEEGESEDEVADFVASLGNGVAAPGPVSDEKDAGKTETKKELPEVDVQMVTNVATASAASAPAPSAPASSGASTSTSNSLRPSPLARRLAEAHNLSVAHVQGTGPRGRVVKRDVEEALRAAPKGGQAPGAETHETVAFSGHEPAFDVQPLTGMRRVIAQRLSASKRTAPHFYVTMDVDMAAVFALRAQMLKNEQKVSVNDVVLWATARALAEHPACNSAWSAEGVRLYRQVDLAVAVALPGGLVTPVIRDAASKSLFQIGAEVKEFAATAREGRLTLDAFQGGTFTLSNMGMFGVKEFAAIVNPPQAGILAVGAARDVPVVDGATVRVGKQMSLTLSVDHRVVDGVDAAQFLGRIKALLEQPALMAVSG